MSTSDVTLVAGAYFEQYDIDTGLWYRIPRLTSTGETGSTADAKEKTTTEDRIKRYGTGLFDGGDKTLKGQWIPEQDEGSEHYADYELQKRFLDRAENTEEMPMRLNYPNRKRGVFTFKSLGMMIDDGTAEDWLMFTVGGKQNSKVDWSTPAPELTAITAGDPIEIEVGAGNLISLTNTPLDAFWLVNGDQFVSSDITVASVTKWGYVKALTEGTTTITCKRDIGDGTFIETTADVTVTVTAA